MRLITRGDLDGLACAILLTTFEDISEIVLVHPQDITDDKLEITEDDIITNLPFHPKVGIWFDHHLLTSTNRRPKGEFRGRYALAPSAARLVWEHYGKDPRFAGLINETDRLDSAQLDVDDVRDPQGYILLGFTVDSRSGLGAFEDYFKKCVEWVKEKSIGEVLQEPEVAERVKKLRENTEKFRQALIDCSTLDGTVIFTDFRKYAKPPIGNRFLIYSLYPGANVSLRVHWGPGKEKVIAAVGHSIFQRTCKTNVGELMSRYGGGGHTGAGTAPLPVDQADEKIAEILERLKRTG